jgi:putative ABC transport system permease protein
MWWNYAARQLRKNPGFAFFSITTLAVGIGSATAAFSILDPWLVRPLALKEPERLAHLWRTRTSNPGQPAFFFDYQDYLKFAEARSFSSVSATFYRTLTLTGRGRPQDVMGETTTSNFRYAWDTCRHREDVCTARCGWRKDRDPERCFLAPEVRSRQINRGTNNQSERRPYRVIGILPLDFSYRILDQPVDAAAWTVIQRNDGNYQGDSKAAVAILGRLAAGVTQDQEQAEVSAIQARADRERARLPEAYIGSKTLVSGLQEDDARQLRFSLLVLAGAVSFLLLIACANTSALILGRNETRHAEFAMRASLGAGSRQIFQQLFAENLCCIRSARPVG